MKKDLYTEYAALTAQMNEIEEKREAMKKTILEKMQEEQRESVEHALGKFAIQYRKKWTYPEAVKKLEQRWKVAKVDAEESGVATFEENGSLYFTPIKI